MAQAAKAKTKTTKKAVKKPVATTKRITAKKKSQPAAALKPEFFQVRITDQSLYWLVFGVVSILFALWVYSLDSRVRDLYDEIDTDAYKADAMLEIHAAQEKAKQAVQ